MSFISCASVFDNIYNFTVYCAKKKILCIRNNDMVLLDIKEGILQKFYKYIVIIVITLLISVMYIYTYNNLIQEGKIDNTGFTIADIWIYCFRGKLIEVSNGIAELPSVVYLLFQLIIAFIIGDYARGRL